MQYVIAELIRNHKGSSWLAMERAIASANLFRVKAHRRDRVKKNEITIDRRKLQQIGEDLPGVPLTAFEYELLDAYLLRKTGTGLAEIPIFRREENLFHTLSAAERVSFFVGVRWIEALNNDMIARWDVSALNVMKDSISTHVETESFEVNTRNTTRPLDPQDWQTLRNQATGKVVVSIASPVACASSEYLLADMFGFDPYEPGSSAPPLRFVHPDNDFESAFLVEPTEVPGLRKDGTAMMINDKTHRSRRNGPDFGVVVGTRTAPDHAAFVIAGNSGPGTFAAAEFFASGRISTTLPRYERKGSQPVLVALVNTSIHSTQSDRRIDTRSVGETCLKSPPMVFRHGRGGWQAEEVEAA